MPITLYSFGVYVFTSVAPEGISVIPDIRAYLDFFKAIYGLWIKFSDTYNVDYSLLVNFSKPKQVPKKAHVFFLSLLYASDAGNIISQALWLFPCGYYLRSELPTPTATNLRTVN